MIGVTERAKQELKRILCDKVDNPLAGWRLTIGDEGQLRLGMDVEMPGDQVVEHQGSKVLMVEPVLAEGLQGVTIGVADTPEGPKLSIFDES
jgi:hypothetical protein